MASGTVEEWGPGDQAVAMISPGVRRGACTRVVATGMETGGHTWPGGLAEGLGVGWGIATTRSQSQD